jgi:hypothetical protein
VRIYTSDGEVRKTTYHRGDGDTESCRFLIRDVVRGLDQHMFFPGCVLAKGTIVRNGRASVKD